MRRGEVAGNSSVALPTYARETVGVPLVWHPLEAAGIDHPHMWRSVSRQAGDAAAVLERGDRQRPELLDPRAQFRLVVEPAGRDRSVEVTGKKPRGGRDLADVTLDDKKVAWH